ncbi:hypothetical protein WA026_019637 [Henosepilachna vigintioctopunctata]|uniref:Reverse transcriptase domain-containing protein n=1 Tax=Henosepilachna vigintioctopunctata TaxID=420089 RepID=A0AAW1U0F5_9CUCU
MLFNLYLNDLPKNIRCDHLCNYADDTSLLNVDHKSANRKTEVALRDAEICFDANGLLLNRGKTKILSVGKRLTPDSIEHAKFLGLVMQSNFIFSQHVENVIKKLSSVIFWLVSQSDDHESNIFPLCPASVASSCNEESPMDGASLNHEDATDTEADGRNIPENEPNRPVPSGSAAKMLWHYMQVKINKSQEEEIT